MSLDLCVQITNYTLLVYFSGAHNLLFPLVSVVLQVLWSCLIFFWSSFSLDGPRLPEYAKSHHCSMTVRLKQNKTQLLGKLITLDTCSTISSPRMSWVLELPPACSVLNWGEGLRWVSTLVQSIAFVLSCPQPSTLSYQCLDSGRRETSPSDSSLKSLSIKHMFLSCLSLLREMPGAGSFF